MFSTSYQSIIKVLSVLIGYACITFNQSVVLLLHHINRWCYHATCTHSGCIFKCPCGPWRASTRSDRQDVVSSISWSWSCKSTNRRLQWRERFHSIFNINRNMLWLLSLHPASFGIITQREKRRLPCYWTLATSYRLLVHDTYCTYYILIHVTYVMDLQCIIHNVYIIHS